MLVNSYSVASIFYKFAMGTNIAASVFWYCFSFYLLLMPCFNIDYQRFQEGIMRRSYMLELLDHPFNTQSKISWMNEFRNNMVSHELLMQNIHRMHTLIRIYNK